MSKLLAVIFGLAASASVPGIKVAKRSNAGGYGSGKSVTKTKRYEKGRRKMAKMSKRANRR